MSQTQKTLNNDGKAHMSTEADKLESMIGTGKDFGPLVQTLKMAIERGDIDKENVHRMAHGLGIKPETLAHMLGIESKDSIHAEDQIDSPKNEVSPPDVQKNFKDFRIETREAEQVAESSTAMSTKDQTLLYQQLVKTAIPPAEARKQVQAMAKQARTVHGRAGETAASERESISSMLGNPRIRAVARMENIKAAKLAAEEQKAQQQGQGQQHGRRH